MVPFQLEILQVMGADVVALRDHLSTHGNWKAPSIYHYY